MCLARIPFSHYGLNALETHVSKIEVPLEPFLFSMGKIGVGLLDKVHNSGQWFCNTIEICMAESKRGWEIVLWIDWDKDR